MTRTPVNAVTVHEHWKRLVRMYVVGGTDADVDAIARRAAELRPNSKDCYGIWHATWEHKGARGHCPCVPCRAARRLPPIKI